MNAPMNEISHPTPESVLIRRWFAAPPALLWKFWTEPEHIVRWFGPVGVTCERAEADLRPGGAWGIDMRGENRHRVRGVYEMVDAPMRLRSTWAWLEEDDTLGPESVYEVEITPEGDGALLMLRHTLATADAAQNHKNGWTSSFEKLAEAVAA
ncbi:MAG: SRPBCC domain-containing protein [Pseudomonadota bacterium]